ncbi:MAG TPA: hypothetical protein VM262_21280 [Acidimicrobiales bacterium]|nr:hypothetical protein [Acidimicrobiales bacterium]
MAPRGRRSTLVDIADLSGSWAASWSTTPSYPTAPATFEGSWRDLTTRRDLMTCTYTN